MDGRWEGSFCKVLRMRCASGGGQACGSGGGGLPQIFSANATWLTAMYGGALAAISYSTHLRQLQAHPCGYGTGDLQQCSYELQCHLQTRQRHAFVVIAL